MRAAKPFKQGKYGGFIFLVYIYCAVVARSSRDFGTFRVCRPDVHSIPPYRASNCPENMAENVGFPVISPKPHLRLKEDLAGQIYTLDGFFSPEELEKIMRWTKSVVMEAPKRSGKGEAERTARK